MKNNTSILIFAFLCMFEGFAQTNISKIDTLKEVVVKTNRIDLPFKANARTIQIIEASDIAKSAAITVADVLQQVAGVDIRRRGTGGGQADLYIRGGGFDQTLLLIDGIKMDDAQTGHHTLNAALPLEVIERIEIIKGPAARIFGQNAFTGAINIVTKKEVAPLSINVEAGSFGQLNYGITTGKETENASFIAHIGALTSEGYRNNSDYNNRNYFVKAILNKKKQPIEVIGTFFDKKFGAENFYTTNPAFNEYEETQNSLLGVSTTFKTDKFKITPRVYWRRGQDIFLLKRNDPSFFRNLHITHKVGVETNVSYTSKLGVTGFGVDFSRFSIQSNNLGNRNRTMANVFVEHRFTLSKFVDVTPGVAVSYFSDFKLNAFPGMDIGVQLSEKIKAYGNIGYTFRVPTFTDLYYSDPATLGNPNLEPESAFAQEIGVKYSNTNFSGSMAFFNRDSDNLIDYIRESTETPIFTAANIANVNTQGIEFEGNYHFTIFNFKQTLHASYTYLNDNILDQNKDLSRYSLNTLKHQFITRFTSKLFKNLQQNIIYKHAERAIGTSYNVWDASVILNLKKFDITFTANNIFNAKYIESGFVPMPPSNVLFGLRYTM